MSFLLSLVVDTNLLQECISVEGQLPACQKVAANKFQQFQGGRGQGKDGRDKDWLKCKNFGSSDQLMFIGQSGSNHSVFY